MPPPPTSTPTTISTNLTADLTSHLTARGLPPTPAWLHTTLLPTLSVRPNTPLAATRQTALFRLLASDVASSPSPLAHSPASNRLPANVATSGATAREAVVPGPVAVQVLDVEDVGRSRWAQVEALEARARGEGTRGREVVRLVDDDGDGDGEDGGGGAARTMTATDAGGGGKGPHKLLLVDAAGTRVYGFELAPVPGVGVERMGIGAKLVLRNAVVARGVVLLEPRTATCLGGKVEALDKPWREGRLARLREVAR